jgi:hypothetical protein
MFKHEHIREEDYWIYPIVFINVLAGGIAIWASVILFRGPALAVAALGIWFTSSKVRRDYSPARARLHITLTVLASVLLAWFTYALTN